MNGHLGPLGPVPVGVTFYRENRDNAKFKINRTSLCFVIFNFRYDSRKLQI